jgi:hypothetical protein
LKLLAITCLALTLMAGLCPGQNDSGPSGILGHLWLSGQLNVISQGHATFRSPYSGPNSFAAPGEIATSRVLTLYTGFRFSDTTDFLFDLEETSGHNLSGSHGLAAFPNVDLAGVPDAHPYVARAMLHHEFRLSSAEIDAGQGPLQMAARVAVRRVEIYAGKMSMLDFFDVNAVGSDSHYQFMNWTLDNNAAYGYPADSRGYTDALVVEFHDRAWAARFGEALTPALSNPDRLDLNLARSRSESVEFELQHRVIPERRGIIRALSFVDHGSFGSYRTAVSDWQAHRTPVPDVTATRVPGRSKYGFGVNIEQELTATLRAFGRFGWAEGHFETLAFTEADQTVSGGFDLRGDRWRRKDDKVGIAAVSSGLSGDHREYLALGGTGLVLGDGALDYRREFVLETYYTARIWRGVYASIDIQRVWNPGYNMDRGPALVGALRLHLEGALFSSPR